MWVEMTPPCALLVSLWVLCELLWPSPLLLQIVAQSPLPPPDCTSGVETEYTSHPLQAFGDAKPESPAIKPAHWHAKHCHLNTVSLKHKMQDCISLHLRNTTRPKLLASLLGICELSGDRRLRMYQPPQHHQLCQQQGSHDEDVVASEQTGSAESNWRLTAEVGLKCRQSTTQCSQLFGYLVLLLLQRVKSLLQWAASKHQRRWRWCHITVVHCRVFTCDKQSTHSLTHSFTHCRSIIIPAIMLATNIQYIHMICYIQSGTKKWYRF